MDPHSFIARAEAQRWLGIAEKLLISHDLVGSKTFAIRARESDPRLEAAEQILAIADTLLAAEKRVVGNNGNHQPDYYAILQLVRFVQDTDQIASQYRRLAVLLNPHQNTFPYSDQAFQLVNDAWGVLSNPMRKSMYDSDLDYPPEQQMNSLGFNLEQQHHQQQQPHNFFSINHMATSHDQELPEQQQTFQSRLHQSHQNQHQHQHQHQHQQLQQHNFLSQPNPVRPLPVREQEHLFQHREQDQLFQSQVQPFQVTSPPHQTRPSPSPSPQPSHIQSPPATPQPPFSWAQTQQMSQSQQQYQHQQMKQEQLQQEQLKKQQMQQKMQQDQLKQQQLQEEQRKLQQLQQEKLKQQQLMEEQRKQQQMMEEQRKQQQMIEEQRKQQQMMEEQRKQQQMMEEQRKQQQMMEEQRKQQKLMEEQRKQQLMEEQRKQQQKLMEEQRKQQLMEEQRKQQQLMEEQRKQQQLMEEQRKQQQLMEEQRKQQQLLEEQRKQQQMIEEQRKQQQILEEQRKQQQLMEEQRKQQFLEEQRKQQLLEEQRKQQQLEEEKRKQQLLEEQRKQQQLQEEQLKKQQLQEEQLKQQQMQQEQLKQQQLQESMKQNTIPVEPPGMFNTNNGVTEPEPEPEPEPETETEAETEPVDDSPTFWTACPYCFYMYEYPNLYIECTLRCDNCNRAFQAVPISSPPPIIEGQDACFYCWGFIPVGLSLTDLPKNNSKSTNSNWTPFSSLHDATNNASNNVQNHLNEQAAPKQNPFVNKSSGPRIYIDDITDNVFLGVSDPSSDSDAEWDFTKNITKKQKSKTAKVNTGFKERIQVLALRALDTRTQNGTSKTKNLKPGRVAKELGKLDLNVEFNTNEGEETGRRAINKARGLAREEDNIEGVGFFEGLDEYLSSLPILSGVKEEKVNVS